MYLKKKLIKLNNRIVWIFQIKNSESCLKISCRTLKKTLSINFCDFSEWWGNLNLFTRRLKLNFHHSLYVHATKLIISAWTKTLCSFNMPQMVEQKKYKKKSSKQNSNGSYSDVIFYRDVLLNHENMDFFL